MNKIFNPIFIIIVCILSVSMLFSFIYTKNKNPSLHITKEKDTELFFELPDYTQPKKLISTTETTIYTDTQYHFIFSHPSTFKTSAFQEEDYTVLVQDENNHAIQIYVSAFDEDIILTPERIKNDIPDIIMNNTKTVPVGGVPAQSFTSTNELFGTTREVWFVHKNNLYQIVTSPELDTTLASMLLNWKFN